MKSKTSLFNKTIFLNTLRRYWVMWVGYTIALLLFIALSLVNELQRNQRYPFHELDASVSYLLSNGPVMGLLVSLFSAGIITAILYSYLYNTRHTGMMNSLPIKRETMFLSVFLAGFVGMLLGDVVLILCCMVAELAYGQVSVAALGILFLILVLENIMFLGFGAFCCMLTGNIFAGPAVYLIFNATAVVVETMSTTILDRIVYGAPSSLNLRFQWLSPVFEVSQKLNLMETYERNELNEIINYTYKMEGVGVLAAYCLVGILFAVFALMLYKRRHMETAGDVVAIPVLEPVFKVCASLAGALCFTILVAELLYDIRLYGTMRMVFLAVLMIVGGIIGWFIAQMLVEKSLRVFHHGWKGVGIMSLVFILFLAAAEFDWTGYERRVPGTEDVESVYINCAGVDSGTFNEPENIAAILQLHRNVISNKELHELAEENDQDRRYFNVTYTLKNGNVVSREYYLSAAADQYLDSNSDMRTLETIMNTEEAIHERYLLEEVVTGENMDYCDISYMDAETGEWKDYYDLTPTQMAELYNDYIVPDILDGSLGYIHLLEDDDYAREKYNCQIRLEMRFPHDVGGNAYILREDGTGSYYHRTMTIYLTVDAERTVGYLNELGIYPMTIEETAAMEGTIRYTETGYQVIEKNAVADSGDAMTSTMPTRVAEPAAAVVEQVG